MGEDIFEYLSNLAERFLQNLGNWFSDHGFEILIILLVAWLVKTFGSKLLSRIFHSTIRPDLYPTKTDRIQRLETLDGITHGILKAGVVLVAAIMIVSELGVNTTPLIASAGVIGIALGFGAQSLIKDFTNGIFTILDNQYRVGDVVKLYDTAAKVDIAGKVEAINIRTTVLRGLDGTMYHVPNGSISTTANLTMSYGGLDEDILFDKSVDVSKLSLIIDRIGKDMAADPDFEKKIKQPPHFERVVSIGVDGITAKVIGTTSTSDSWEVRGEFYKRLITELRKAKIDLPSTQVTVNTAKAAAKAKKTKS